MRMTMLRAGLIALAVITLFGIWKNHQSDPRAAKPSKRELILYGIENSSLRKSHMVDSETRFDSAYGAPDGDTLIYNYTMINLSANQISVVGADRLREGIIGKMCSRQGDTLLVHGISLLQKYRSSDGHEIASIHIEPGKCFLDPDSGKFILKP